MNEQTITALVDVPAFKSFLLNNNIIATTAGVLIGYSAWDFIQSLVGDLLLPGFYFLFLSRLVTGSPTMSRVFQPVHKLDLSKFVARTFSFVFVIVLTFWSIQYIIGHWVAKDQNQNHNQMQQGKESEKIPNEPKGTGNMESKPTSAKVK